MRIVFSALLVFVFSLGLCSCSGYTILTSSKALSDLGRSMQTEGIYLAPISKDISGQFTSALTYELCKRSLPLRINENHARYILKIQFLNEVDENIGFTYAPNKVNDNPQKHFIVSNEGRLSTSVQIQLIDKHSGQTIIKDCIKTQSVSFDFEPDLGNKNAQQFALGQFGMHNEAIKSAWRVLHTHLAETIVQQVHYMTSSDREAVFPAILSELHNMLNFIKESQQLKAYSKEKLMKLELACEELLVNIISYAYQDSQNPGPITIRCNGDKQTIQVTIEDNGFSFNPVTATTDIQSHVPLEDRKLGGLGIFLAKSSVDDLQYERHNGSNIVHLTVHNDAAIG